MTSTVDNDFITADHRGDLKHNGHSPFNHSDTDDEDEDEEILSGGQVESEKSNEIRGILSKWTNYIHGWQDRCVVIKDGVLSYYKNEDDLSTGCRGAVHLAKAVVALHQFDDCRFDVTLGDSVWYLRAPSEQERSRWVMAIESNREGGGSEPSLRRHPSLLSITSATSLSNTSQASFKRSRQLRETLAETATYRDLLCRQLDILQSYFDSCASAMALYQRSVLDEDTHSVGEGDGHEHQSVNSSPVASDNHHHGHHPDFSSIFHQHGSHAIDFKSEAAAFKATTVAIVQNIASCMDLIQQREEHWKKRLEKEVERRKKVQARFEEAQASKKRMPPIEGPDFEEGPNCRLNEDEFYDAVDLELDKIEQSMEDKAKNKIEIISEVKLPTDHELYNEIDSKVQEFMANCKFTLPESKEWELIADEGAMKVYRREYERDGVVLDPLKAVNQVKGLTGRELCQYFFDPAIRLEWEVTLENCKVVNWLSEDTVVLYQVLKRVWPTTQRDCIYWSHIRHLVTEEGADYWV